MKLHTSRKAVIRLFALSLPLFASGVAPAEPPAIADGKGGATMWTLRDAQYDLDKAMLLDDYNKFGQHDPKWDEQARELLSKIATVIANDENSHWQAVDERRRSPDISPRAVLSPYSRPAAGTTLPELIEQAHALAETGCTDPAVQYCILFVGQYAEDYGACKKFYPFYEPLLTSKYSLFLKCRATRVLRSGQGYATPEIIKSKRAAAGDLLIAYLEELPSDDIGRRLQVATARSYFESNGFGYGSPEQDDFIAKFKKSKTDPWVKNVLVGLYEVSIGIDSFPSEHLKDRKPEMFEQGESRLKQASESLAAAYKAKPALPEAPAAMIAVATYLGPQQRANAMEWFARASKAQIDFEDAWYRVEYAVRPKWGGSFEQMYALADKAAATKRFDTDVPWRYVRLLWLTAKDGGGVNVYRRPTVWKTVQGIYDGYAAKKMVTFDPIAMKSEMAAVAIKAEQFKAAETILKELDYKVDEEVFKDYDLRSMNDLRQLLAAANSDVGEKVVAAIHAQEQGKQLLSANAFEELQKALDTSHPARPYIDRQVLVANIKLAFATGKKVTIPLEDENDLAAWTDVTPNVTIKDKMLHFTAGDSYESQHGKLTLLGGLPDNYMLTMSVMMNNTKKRSNRVDVGFTNMKEKFPLYISFGNRGDVLGMEGFFIRQSVKGLAPFKADEWHQLSVIMHRHGNWIVAMDGKPTDEGTVELPPGAFDEDKKPELSIEFSSNKILGTIDIKDIVIEPLKK